MVRVKGVEPPRREALDPKSRASASSATSADMIVVGVTGLEPVAPCL